MSWENIRGELFTLLKLAAVVYCVLCVALYFAQRKMQYFPDKQAYVPAEAGAVRFETLGVAIEGGLMVSSWYRPAEAGKPVIVYMHGNGGGFGIRGFRIDAWVRAGYGVALVSYPGYEGNDGTPTEKGIYQSARGVIQVLLDRGVEASQIVLLGESLGSGVAVQMATEFPVAGIMLEAPFTSVPDVAAYHYRYIAVRWFLWDIYDSLSKMARVKAPLLVIHGEADVIVPVAQGRRLLEAAAGPKEGLFIPGAGHGDLYTDAVNAAEMAFAEKVTRGL